MALESPSLNDLARTLGFTLESASLGDINRILGSPFESPSFEDITQVLTGERTTTVEKLFRGAEAWRQRNQAGSSSFFERVAATFLSAIPGGSVVANAIGVADARSLLPSFATVALNPLSNVGLAATTPTVRDVRLGLNPDDPELKPVRDVVLATSKPGATPMSLNLGGIIQGAVGVIGGLESGNYLGALNAGANLATSFLPAPAIYSPAVPAQPILVGQNQSSVPVVAGQRGTTMTKEVFDALNKLLSKLGISTRTVGSFMSASKRALSTIASFARRTPTGTIVSVLVGLGLTAYEANLLTAWHAQRRKHRRMNPANHRALRRSVRRIKAFHRLCASADVLKSRTRRTSFGRCGSCKKSPCRC